MTGAAPASPAIVGTLVAALLALSTAPGAASAQPGEADSAPADVPAPAPARDPRIERAGAAFDEGQAAFEGGDFATAADRFSEVYELTRSPDIAFNLGLCYERLGRLEQAAVWYRTYVQASPDAPDRAEVEARIESLTAVAPGSADVGRPPPGEPGIAPHRLRAGLGWGFAPDGAFVSAAPPAPVDAGGFHLSLGYQLGLVGGLALDVEGGVTFVSDIQGTARTVDLWSIGAGLAYVWTSLPYVNLALRGDFCLDVFIPSVGDAYYLVPFRAGAWIEVPIADWIAIHAGGDFGVGPYVARDDKSFGFLVEAVAGLTFSLGGDDGGSGEAASSGAPPPARPREVDRDILDRAWQ